MISSEDCGVSISYSVVALWRDHFTACIDMTAYSDLKSMIRHASVELRKTWRNLQNLSFKAFKVEAFNLLCTGNTRSTGLHFSTVLDSEPVKELPFSSRGMKQETVLHDVGSAHPLCWNLRLYLPQLEPLCWTDWSKNSSGCVSRPFPVAKWVQLLLINGNNLLK